MEGYRVAALSQWTSSKLLSSDQELYAKEHSGDTFIKNNYVVFDQGPVPKVGVAYRPDIRFSAT